MPDRDYRYCVSFPAYLKEKIRQYMRANHGRVDYVFQNEEFLTDSATGANAIRAYVDGASYSRRSTDAVADVLGSLPVCASCENPRLVKLATLIAVGAGTVKAKVA